MKSEQMQQAREMYFQTTLSKTEIAEKLNVSRRSVSQWSVDGDWDKLRASARCMPTMLAEKCYYLINHFTDHLLSKESSHQSITKADVEILYKLTKTINLLKKGSTINEDMETFTFFLDGLQKRDAALAQALIPYADEFVSCRAAKSPMDNVLNGYTTEGYKPSSEKEIMEKWLDAVETQNLASPHNTGQKIKNTSAVETQNLASPHNTGQKIKNTSAVETQNLASLHNMGQTPPSPHNTVNNTNTNPGDTDAQLPVANDTPKNTPPAPAARLATGSKYDKNYKAVFWENRAKEKARKEAAKNRKAA